MGFSQRSGTGYVGPERVRQLLGRKDEVSVLSRSQSVKQEILAFAFYYQYGVPVSILRLSAVVGLRGVDGGRMWQDLATQMKEGKEIQLPQFSPEDRKN